MGITMIHSSPQVRNGQISWEYACDPKPKLYTSPLCISYGMFIYLQEIRTGPKKRSFLEEQHYENTFDP